MNFSIADIIHAYLRELSTHRKWFALCFLAIALASLAMVATWPKTYVSSSTIYADNSNILQPLMAGNAVTTKIVDQARLAQEILFKRSYMEEVLKAGGWDVSQLTSAQRDALVLNVQSRTEVINVGRAPASLIKIGYRDADPIRAFNVAQKYTQLFIEESVVKKREESRGAFDFIQNQVTAYQTNLLASEAALSKFKNENYSGTLADANARISRYRSEIESLELELAQLATQESTLELELAGEAEVVRGMNEMSGLRNRINTLQLQLDSLKSRYHDNYPDVVQVQVMIDDLMYQYEHGNTGALASLEDASNSALGINALHQELRGRLSSIKTNKQSKLTQLNAIRSLLEVEMQRVKQINDSDAVLAELTRDYNVTRDFYNDMLKRLENARVSMNLDEQQQGVTFKVQESPVIPTQPDGLGFLQLLGGSFMLAAFAPLGLLFVYMELDPRIRTEANFREDWPPLLISVPPMKSAKRRRWISDGVFLGFMIFLAAGLYGGTVVMNMAGYI